MARKKIVGAILQGELIIGDLVIPCAVLKDGTRVLTQKGFSRALGRVKYSSKVVTKLPPFLSANNLKPFISEELQEVTTPIKFKSISGGGYKGYSYGYNASLLPAVCDIYLQARKAGVLLKNQLHYADQCEILVRGLAETGIVGLVDEATGYQHIRDHDALQKILELFISKELMKWQKRFPDEYYEQIFRLKRWQYKGRGFNPPQLVGRYTNDIVYDRLAPGVLEELESKNPKDEKGKRLHKHHQWLTEDIGHPALRDHLSGIIALMRAAPNWTNFKRMLERSYPKPGTQTEFEMEFHSGSGSGY